VNEKKTALRFNSCLHSTRRLKDLEKAARSSGNKINYNLNTL